MQKLIVKYGLPIAVAGLIVGLVSLNILFRLLGGGAVLDLTDDSRYSLSEYSREQARRLSRPLYITIYYSSELPKENPQYGRYAEFVLHFLRQYQRQNPDKIFLTVKNPEPYSEQEKEARAKGLEPYLSADGRSNLYFGAVFSDSNGQEYPISDFRAERRFWLEKDITSVFARFNEPERKIIGLISPIHKMIKRDYAAVAESYAFIQELTARYDVLELAQNVEDIPDVVSVLVVVTPQKMTMGLLYALDQYVLRGGRLIMLLDTVVEKPYYKTTKETRENINRLLRQWGVSLSDSLVGSRLYGKKIYIGEEQDRHLAPYPFWLDLPRTALTEDLHGQLKNIELRTASELHKTENTSGEFSLTPLLRTSGGAYPVTAYSPMPAAVTEKYAVETRERVLAYLIEGKFQSAFTEQPASITEEKHPFLFYSARQGRIVIIGDSDFIRDDVWLQDGRLNDNGQLLLREIEFSAGNPEMAELYKSQPLSGGETLGRNLYDKIFNRYAGEMMSLQNDLQALRQEQERHLSDIRTGRRMIDSTLSARLNEIDRQIKDAENRLQYYDYAIKQAFASVTRSIIFMNMAVIPLLILLLCIMTRNWHERRCRRRIEEKYNVRR